MWEVNKREELMLCWQMDLINNLGFFVSTGKMEPGQWLPDGGLPFPPFPVPFIELWSIKSGTGYYCSSLHNTKTCLPFDCAYSGCESRLTMLVLTQQTDRVWAPCQWAGMLDCQCWSWHCCCSHSETRKLASERMCKNRISSFLWHEERWNLS